MRSTAGWLLRSNCWYLQQLWFDCRFGILIIDFLNYGKGAVVALLCFPQFQTTEQELLTNHTRDTKPQ